MREVVDYFGGDVGVAVHLHDDAGTGVANALAGVRGGAIQVQGTINGYGERTGNCNLTTIIPNLTLKMGIETHPGRPARAAHAGGPPRGRAREHGAQPAGALRGLLGVRAQGRAARERDRASAPTPTSTFAPSPSATARAFVVSELAGRSDAGDQGEGARPRARRASAERDRRHAEAARARGLPLRGRRRVARAAHAAGDRLGAGVVPGRGVPGDHRRRHARRVARERRHDRGDRARCTSTATRSIATAEGNGPVNALDAALRKALGGRYPALEQVHLTDYKVRVLDTTKGTGAVTRVLVDSTDGERTWTTIGVSENIIEASWQALDGLDRVRLAARRAARVAISPCPPTRSSSPSASTTRPASSRTCPRA